MSSSLNFSFQPGSYMFVQVGLVLTLKAEALPASVPACTAESTLGLNEKIFWPQWM